MRGESNVSNIKYEHFNIFVIFLNVDSYLLLNNLRMVHFFVVALFGAPIRLHDTTLSFSTGLFLLLLSNFSLLSFFFFLIFSFLFFFFLSFYISFRLLAWLTMLMSNNHSEKWRPVLTHVPFPAKTSFVIITCKYKQLGNRAKRIRDLYTEWQVDILALVVLAWPFLQSSLLLFR